MERFWYRNRTKNDKPMYPCRKAVFAAMMISVMEIGVMGTSQFYTLFTYIAEMIVKIVFAFCF